MTRNDSAELSSSTTNTSFDSARSSVTVQPSRSNPKPIPSSLTTADTGPASGSFLNLEPTTPVTAIPRTDYNGSLMRLRTDDHHGASANEYSSGRDTDREDEISPTTLPAAPPNPRPALSPSPAITPNAASNFRDRRLSDFANYRRELAVLDTSLSGGPRIPHIQHNPPTATSHIAPWMSSNGAGANGANTPSGLQTTFYNDSSDNLSSASQLSPAYRTGAATLAAPGASNLDSPDAMSYNDERRPSVASITTASSQGSKNSSATRGGFRKLQGFFGEEFPGRDSSDTSLPTTSGKETRSRSYSHTRTRDRNYSNATDTTRDASPASSRPRTPVPAPEVVPFLYQDSADIARLGEAPVRSNLTGPDRERYANETPQYPPKTSSSSRSGYATLTGYQHRYNKSNDDSRSLRPTISREESSVAGGRERSNILSNIRSRAQSPTPSVRSMGPTTHHDSQHSPPGSTSTRRGFLGRFRRHKDKDEAKLRDLPVQSRAALSAKLSRTDLTLRPDAASSPAPSSWSVMEPEAAADSASIDPRQTPSRGTTFNNKFPFTKKRPQKTWDYTDEQIGPTDRKDASGTLFNLDTNLSDMEGILMQPQPLTPMDTSFVANPEPAEKVDPALASGVMGAWYAPDSWAVRRGTEDASLHAGDDEHNNSPKPEEKTTPYGIRIFRSDGTFSTLQMSLKATVADVISQLIKKTYLVENFENFQIIIRKHDLIRILSPMERPLMVQKRLLQQIGYEDEDRIEEIGREDNSYLCRFMFLAHRESDFHSITHDSNLARGQKNHVDITARNLITIPISLYSRASDIISLNLSKNLSLEVPRDFIQSCQNLREVRFNYNEARKLPSSLGWASKLQILDVSNNLLEQLDQVDLHQVQGLLKLNLANNRLNKLPSYLGQYRYLRTLNVSSNFLDKFPPFLCNLPALVDLDLSFNSIATVPEEIGTLQNLEKLVITNNKLAKDLPATFRNLRSLRELDVKFNVLHCIDVVSELPKLEVLTADHNQISNFRGAFDRLQRLKLNANPLTKFDLVRSVPSLKILNLADTQLASMDGSWENMAGLERLVLDKNYFASLPAQIGMLTKLEHLSLANNFLGELPPQIGCLTELRVLIVRGNNISKLPTEMWFANKLETLNASSNLLEHFPKPASRAPRVGEDPHSPAGNNGKTAAAATPASHPPTPSIEEVPEDGSRRPSGQSSNTLLSVGPSPVPGSDRKPSVVSVYGKGGRKTSVVSRSASAGTVKTAAPTARKDSAQASRLQQTFSGSLRNLYLADNQLDDDVFDQLTLLGELRVLNLSLNSITDIPQRSIKTWPQLVELYLSCNDLTTLPADDIEDNSLLQVLHINGNKFINLPAEISRAKKLAILDCGSNNLKYNIANVPYDWNWNLNPNLRYLNLSGNKRLEIKQHSSGIRDHSQYTDFSRLQNLRVLGLMDVTLTSPTIPEQSEDRRVRTSPSLAGHLPYGMADTMGRHEHLSTVDLVVPRFNSSETEMLLGLFDGQALSSGGSKIAKFLHENFKHVFSMELKQLRTRLNETPAAALRRSFLSLNKELVTMAFQHTEDRPHTTHRGSSPGVVLSKEDLSSGGVATVVYIADEELYVANVGDIEAMLIHTDGSHKILTKKHDPAVPSERQRIRDAGGWVSRSGKLNDVLDVSRAFGYLDMMPAVQAAPDVMHKTLTPSDDIILIATRDLWQYLRPELVVDIARSERGDLMRASQKLRDLAIAYGATSKIMVMMIGVTDLKRRVERSRLTRGQSMSFYPSGIPAEAQLLSTKRGKRGKADVADSNLLRIGTEIPAPRGDVAIVFTDIKNSTALWEMYEPSMRTAIRLHNDLMRRQYRRIGGYEVKTEGDAFMVSFPTATSALLWCFAVQTHLLEVAWPPEILKTVHCKEVLDKEGSVIFKGLSVRMGIHWGYCVSEVDPVTQRMDYFGPMVNKASRISAVADGGQITVSRDFIDEINRCLFQYSDFERNVSAGSDEAFEDENVAASIRRDLRALSSQGFEVKELGERKLKGLENPEYVYSLYPHSLWGRIVYHQQHEQALAASAAAQQAADVARPAQVASGTEFSFNPQIIWDLWRISLRLEMLCSTLEEVSGPGLQPPETELLERLRQRAGEMTEQFLINFMTHQVSRIETCISTLAMRHMARGGGKIAQLDDLRGPMSSVFTSVTDQLAELQRYKAMFGPLEAYEEDGVQAVDDVDDVDEQRRDSLPRPPSL